MKRRTLSLRLGVLMIFLCLVMTAFFGILWDLQINHQASLRPFPPPGGRSWTAMAAIW